MAGVENMSDLPLTIHDQDTATTGSSPRVYSNINVSGNARVHLGDAYFDNFTINQLCLVHQANEAIVHQIGNLRSIAGGSVRPLDDESVQNQIDETNDRIRLANTRLRKTMTMTENPAPKKRLVSQTKLNFSLIPLAFTFERSVYEEELEVVASQSTLKPKARRHTPPMTTVASLRIPKWFAGYQYSICIERSRSGWLFCPRILRESRCETFYMKACSFGWLDKVQSQLVRNRSAVHDRHNDLTGADSALTHGEFYIASFLADQGIQVTISLDRLVKEVQFIASRTSQLTSAHALRLICPTEQNMTSVSSVNAALKTFELWRDITYQHIDICRRLFDMEDDEFWESLEDSSALGSSREFEWLRLVLKYPLWSPEEAVLSLMRLVDVWISLYGDKKYALYLAESILRYYEKDLPLEALRLEYECDGNKLTVLYWIFVNIGRLIELNQPIDSVWPRYIRYVLCAGVNIHTKSSSHDGPAMTPFWNTCWRHVVFRISELSVFRYPNTGIELRADIDSFIQSLASVLLEAEIDLSVFGKIENESMKEVILFLRDTSSGSDAEPIMWAKDVDYLAYGSTPADWRIRYLSDYRKQLNDLTDDLSMVQGNSIYHIIAAIIQNQAQRDGLHVNVPTSTLKTREFAEVTDYIGTVLRLRASLQGMNEDPNTPASCAVNTASLIHRLCKVYSFLDESFQGGTGPRFWILVYYIFLSLQTNALVPSNEWWASGTILLCEPFCTKCDATLDGTSWTELDGKLVTW